ncbi:AfsR/SARP family transcriptional regulator [Nonomuraea endophytica]|uniref:DNA-binding SARP family transcriptional activator n=1 Tax=Nonomuraea endophytica TaxID=714136 RepID=A0A7W7ZZD0_9ACTN|nr:AfsR/SARP family transcriptional regulator [Nonomuraea endophytica]MBB5076642.1 DNA-binding SARP family transcriptional activator [Nonomuraea endophytica]
MDDTPRLGSLGPVSAGLIELDLLGPVRARRGPVELDLGSPKQRLLLAALALADGRTLGRDQLIDVLWADDPPATARNVLRTYASRLRGVLGREALVSVGSGYRLVPVLTDLAEFERLRDAGRLSDALALWRGEALADLSGPYAEATRAGLEERRLAVLELRLAADLEAGVEVTGELSALVAAYPLRESVRALLMRALYRGGRQAEAIGVFTEARRVLDEELGVEPSAELADVYQQLITGTLPTAPLTAGTAGPVPAQLPGDIPDFTGRQEVVEAVEELLRTGVVAISGLGGVGKTALAVHVAHRVRERYSDGQLHVDLRGAGADPADPALVLERFLDALGADRIPPDPEQRAALLRTLTVDRRALFLLDNAASAAQVRPLLPSGPGSGVLVTSRARLSDLTGARHVDLDVPPEHEAVALFAAVARLPSGPTTAPVPSEQTPARDSSGRTATRVPTEQTAASDPARETVPSGEAVARVVQACGYLPLAVRVAGARLAARPRWSVEDLLTRLSAQRLGELRVGDVGVEASFALSYDQLGEELARGFRRLAVPDSAELTVELAAAVLGRDAREAERTCEELVDLSLLESAAAGRYRYHDLLRDFALARTPEAERRAALATVQASWLAAVTGAAERAMTDPGARELLLEEASCLAAMDRRHRGAPDPELTVGSTLVVARALALVGALDPPPADPFSPADPRIAYARGLLALGLWEAGAHQVVHGKAALEAALAALGR